eukprot:g219.t1
MTSRRQSYFSDTLASQGKVRSKYRKPSKRHSIARSNPQKSAELEARLIGTFGKPQTTGRRKSAYPNEFAIKQLIQSPITTTTKGSSRRRKSVRNTESGKQTTTRRPSSVKLKSRRVSILWEHNTDDDNIDQSSRVQFPRRRTIEGNEKIFSRRRSSLASISELDENVEQEKENFRMLSRASLTEYSKDGHVVRKSYQPSHAPFTAWMERFKFLQHVKNIDGDDVHDHKASIQESVKIAHALNWRQCFHVLKKWKTFVEQKNLTRKCLKAWNIKACGTILEKEQQALRRERHCLEMISAYKDLCSFQLLRRSIRHWQKCIVIERKNAFNDVLAAQRQLLVLKQQQVFGKLKVLVENRKILLHLAAEHNDIKLIQRTFYQFKFQYKLVSLATRIDSRRTLASSGIWRGKARSRYKVLKGMHNTVVMREYLKGWRDVYRRLSRERVIHMQRKTVLMKDLRNVSKLNQYAKIWNRRYVLRKTIVKLRRFIVNRYISARDCYLRLLLRRSFNMIKSIYTAKRRAVKLKEFMDWSFSVSKVTEKDLVPKTAARRGSYVSVMKSVGRMQASMKSINAKQEVKRRHSIATSSFQTRSEKKDKPGPYTTIARRKSMMPRAPISSSLSSNGKLNSKKNPAMKRRKSRVSGTSQLKPIKEEEENITLETLMQMPTVSVLDEKKKQQNKQNTAKSKPNGFSRKIKPIQNNEEPRKKSILEELASVPIKEIKVQKRAKKGIANAQSVPINTVATKFTKRGTNGPRLKTSNVKTSIQKEQKEKGTKHPFALSERKMKREQKNVDSRSKAVKAPIAKAKLDGTKITNESRLKVAQMVSDSLSKIGQIPPKNTVEISKNATNQDSKQNNVTKPVIEKQLSTLKQKIGIRSKKRCKETIINVKNDETSYKGKFITKKGDATENTTRKSSDTIETVSDDRKVTLTKKNSNTGGLSAIAFTIPSEISKGKSVRVKPIVESKREIRSVALLQEKKERKKEPTTTMLMESTDGKLRKNKGNEKTKVQQETITSNQGLRLGNTDITDAAKVSHSPTRTNLKQIATEGNRGQRSIQSSSNVNKGDSNLRKVIPTKKKVKEQRLSFTDKIKAKMQRIEVTPAKEDTLMKESVYSKKTEKMQARRNRLRKVTNEVSMKSTNITTPSKSDTNRIEVTEKDRNFSTRVNLRSPSRSPIPQKQVPKPTPQSTVAPSPLKQAHSPLPLLQVPKPIARKDEKKRQSPLKTNDDNGQRNSPSKIVKIKKKVEKARSSPSRQTWGFTYRHGDGDEGVVEDSSLLPSNSSSVKNIYAKDYNEGWWPKDRSSHSKMKRKEQKPEPIRNLARSVAEDILQSHVKQSKVKVNETPQKKKVARALKQFEEAQKETRKVFASKLKTKKPRKVQKVAKKKKREKQKESPPPSVTIPEVKDPVLNYLTDPLRVSMRPDLAIPSIPQHGSLDLLTQTNPKNRTDIALQAFLEETDATLDKAKNTEIRDTQLSALLNYGANSAGGSGDTQPPTIVVPMNELGDVPDDPFIARLTESEPQQRKKKNERRVAWG